MNEQCRIRRCEQDAHWIVWSKGHPNGDLQPSPYCHQHAQESVKLLWNDSPFPYSMHAAGPYKLVTEQLLRAIK